MQNPAKPDPERQHTRQNDSDKTKYDILLTGDIFL